MVRASQILLSLTASLLFVQFTSQACIFRGSGGDLPLIRNQSDPADILPAKWDVPDNLRDTCPDYNDVENCCDLASIQLLNVKLGLIDGTFGPEQIGCAICATNLKRFWCKYNCDANQADFIIPNSSMVINYQQDPTDPTSIVQVVTSNITLDIATTCDLYESCKNVDFVKALASMSSYQGLFNTFSSQAIV